MLTALNRQWEINEGILRHLVLKVHPHLVDAVLEHAKAGPAPPPAAPAAGATGRCIEVHDVPEFERSGIRRRAYRRSFPKQAGDWRKTACFWETRTSSASFSIRSI